MANIYPQSTVENLIHDLENSGYIIERLSYENIGLGSLLLVSPDEFHYNLVIEELDVGYGCTRYKVSKRRKISKELRNRVEYAQSRAGNFAGYYKYELYQ